MISTKRMAMSAGLLLMQFLVACGTMRATEPGPAMTLPDVAQRPAATSGAIYQANADVRLFEDTKASRVGDVLTVRLEEQTSASKSANTSTSKSTSANLGQPMIFGLQPSHSGVPLFGGSLSGESSFDGSGQSKQSNSLEGEITVTVVDRLPNGNLLISGEKWLTLNQGREFIRLSGVIRPYDIEPDNSVTSGRIANAEISYSSRGVMQAANRMGLFARFFQSILSGY